MCGIVGGWFAHGAPPSEVLDEALARLRHRGPDGEGLLTDGPVTLAMRRLAIIDLPGGGQPISSEDGAVSVVCNGEVYNHVELARDLRARHAFRSGSDVEAIVHGYEELGPAVCERLVGMFAFALWDARRRRLLLARDRFGKKPLYYLHARGSLLFASELKALRVLARALELPWTLREQAVYDYLSLGVVPQPETAFEGVRAVPPATWLEYDGRSLRAAEYWRLERRDRPRSYGAALEGARALVADAVRLRLRADVPVGVFLSGGVDSTVVAFEAAQVVPAGLRTFTVGFDDAVHDESGVAARTARTFGVENSALRLSVAPQALLEQVVAHYDQPFADPSALPSLAVARAAREHVTVVLNGDGGDEVFAGYRRYVGARLLDLLGPGRVAAAQVARPLARALSRARSDRRSAAGFLARLLRGLAQTSAGGRYLVWTNDLLLEEHKRALWRGGPCRPTEQWLAERLPPPGEGDLALLRRGDREVNLLSDLLVKMDMATMAYGLEARSPLLDHRLAELTASVPPGWLVRAGRGKALLKDAYRGRIPDEVLGGRKRGFEVPLARWLATDLRPLVQEALGAGARVRDLLAPSFVDEVARGGAPAGSNGPHLQYALLVLELWLRSEAVG